MIDVENQVYTILAKELRKKFKNISISSENVAKPSSLPHVLIELRDSYTLRGYESSDQKEHYACLYFDIGVYSNKAGHKREECLAILNAVNDILYPLNFTRTSLTPVDNLQDRNIYRLVARYTACTDGKSFFRRY